MTTTTTAPTAEKRVVTDHSTHAHESTSKARQECRKLMAEGKKPALKKATGKAAPKKAAAPKATATAAA